MQTQAGDEYIRELANFIRANERGLAESGPVRRRTQYQQSPSYFLSWLSPRKSDIPVLLKTDIHHLFYLFIRLEALGLPVGSLDIHVDSPSRPMSYQNILPDQKNSDTISLRSSLSVVSSFSLGGSWWSRNEPFDIAAELKYIYSCFTKLPALRVGPPTTKVVNELMQDPPGQNAVPLDTFKNLQHVECEDIDPCTLLGWDHLAESLRSLKIRNSGLHDISVVFIGAVIDDQARRQGKASRSRFRHIPQTTILEHPPSLTSEQGPHDNSDPPFSTANTSTSPVSSTAQLSPLKWNFLKYLFLPDNGLTFFPSELIPYLKSLIHLDLSSNLLVSVPAGLGALYNLVSLNLTDNLIDSVLGIYQNLGQILSLNLSCNRLESLCGLERLLALERVDLRHNLVEESAEVGRFAVLPNISQLWVEGNPFVDIEDRYRVNCFDYFWREGKQITLDGTGPTLYERRNLTTQGVPLPAPSFISSSAPVISVEPSTITTFPHPESISPSPSPHLSPLSTPGLGASRKKKSKRIVDLNGDESMETSPSGSRTRTPIIDHQASQDPSDTINATRSSSVAMADGSSHSTPSSPLSPTVGNVEDRPSRRFRHGRHQTEYHPSFTSQSAHTPLSQPHIRSGSAALSSRSERRRVRVSASVFEPAGSDAWSKQLGVADDNVATYRRQMEDLKRDMGESWLKVYNQSQPSP